MVDQRILNDKEMMDLVLECISSDSKYKKTSERIVNACTKDGGSNLKVQKAAIDKIKEVIKAPPKKHRASEKFYSLKLLNKIVMKKNSELNKYCENKILDRLSKLGEFNTNKDEKSAQSLLTRGNTIFGPEETDTSMSANFLIILLDCIEKWALTFQFQDVENSAKNTGENKFYKVYQNLIDKGVKFPSTFKQQKESKSNDQKIGRNQARQQVNESFNVSQFKSAVKQSPDVFATADTSAISDTTSMMSSKSMTQDKKLVINNLKKKMQKVKEQSKAAKKFLEDPNDHQPQSITMHRQQFEEAMKLGAESVNELMSD